MDRNRDILDWLQLIVFILTPLIGGIYMFMNDSDDKYVAKEIYISDKVGLNNTVMEVKDLVRTGHDKTHFQINSISEDVGRIREQQIRLQVVQEQLKDNIADLTEKR
jgi:O-acetylhomoserine/O-acetylserine sulfhydrylase-like pyridoxal-dependent enzyme|tara:strand:- start:6139 stop:6459 length:321 start_codon:yes stop_codon:yes gene_type:complete